MNRKLLTIKYLILDFLASSIAWGLFFIFRKTFVENGFNSYYMQFVWSDSKLYLGLILIPLFWIGLYTMFGLYRNVYRKSRLREFFRLLTAGALGIVIIFFTLVLDDEVNVYQQYYQSISVLFLLHFTPTAIFRFILSSRVAHKIKHRIIGFKTVIVGTGPKALKIYDELTTATKSEGHFIQGFLSVNGEKREILDMAYLGDMNQLSEVILRNDIEEVIIAIEDSHKAEIPTILTLLEGLKIVIKVLPNMYQHLAGMVKMGNVFGAVLIQIETDVLPPWQKFFKRSFDIVLSLIIIIVGLPMYFIIGLLVKMGSKGPVFYTQERIGIYGNPFRIIKYRSMSVDAELSGPQLSSEEDPRITKMGKFLRKTRIDEFPQFWNVLVGDMSIVGPRPERQFFIDKILTKAPHYNRLHIVKPGITSWGQVKYGYAENIDEMVERLQYDLLYLENISLQLDLKILIYTVLIMFQGRGK